VEAATAAVVRAEAVVRARAEAARAAVAVRVGIAVRLAATAAALEAERDLAAAVRARVEVVAAMAT
jgi:hypothetical protein